MIHWTGEWTCAPVFSLCSSAASAIGIVRPSAILDSGITQPMLEIAPVLKTSFAAEKLNMSLFLKSLKLY